MENGFASAGSRQFGLVEKIHSNNGNNDNKNSIHNRNNDNNRQLQRKSAQNPRRAGLHDRILAKHSISASTQL